VGRIRGGVHRPRAAGLPRDPARGPPGAGDGALAPGEPAGKPLSACEFKRISLTVHNLLEDEQVRKDYGLSAKRRQQIVRMCTEAEDQGCYLTQEDLGRLLDCDVKTIRNDIRVYQQATGSEVPTRGNKKDIGPGVTHREKAVELYIRGKDSTEIARDLQHSLKAIERYITSFCRIVHCQSEVKDSLKTAMITGYSMPVVSRCLSLRDQYLKTRSYRERLGEIEEQGTRYWECVDSKKKAGQKKGKKQ